MRIWNRPASSDLVLMDEMDGMDFMDEMDCMDGMDN